ncbi:MAG: type I methionyl aminopeptidase [Nostocoides sp.]
MGFFGRERIHGKTDAELLAMRAAGLLVGQTLDMLAETVHEGMSTAALDELAEAFIRDHAGTPSFLGYHGFTGTLCTSVNDEIVHGIPGARTLLAGDLLSIDCGAIVQGWHGDAAITLVVEGPAAGRPEDLDLLNATRESLWAGIAALQVGRPLFDVGAAIEDSIVASGERDQRRYGIVEDYVGHGIGTAMHMDPQVPNYRVDARGPKVVSGTTIAIEPMVTLGAQDNRVLADDWTVVTLDGGRAAHWENTVAVTEAGLWVLTEVDGGRAELAAYGATYAPIG